MFGGMQTSSRLHRAATRHLRVAITVVAAAMFLAACKVRLIDTYNKDAEEGLLRTYGKVESLFDAMAEAREPGLRTYARFAERYAEINEMIRVQILRENARPKNAESIGIIAEIDTVFTGYRNAHRETNTFNDVLLPRHRDVMRRLFGAALKAEQVKKDDDNDV